MSGVSAPPGHTVSRSEAGLSLKSKPVWVGEPGITAPELSSKDLKISAAKRRCVSAGVQFEYDGWWPWWWVRTITPALRAFYGAMRVGARAKLYHTWLS